jgi:hypothetical protein
MKRNSSLLIGIVAAAVTFGSLYAFAGPQYFATRAYHNYGYRCDMYNRDRAGWHNWRQEQYRNSEGPQPLKSDTRSNF